MAFCTRRAASTSIRMTCFLELLPCRRLGFRSSGKLQEETQSQQATTIPSSTPIEEETVAGYRPDRYYPAQIGETLHGRYRIVGKLGYGVSSTVWMCRDLDRPGFRVVKICSTDASYRIENDESREVQVLRHLGGVRARHAGREGVRTLEHTFTIRNPQGRIHTCLVHPPLGTSFSELQAALNGKFPLYLVKAATVEVLIALDFLHSEAKVIHTDLQPTNILFSLKDESALAEYEKFEQLQPSARKSDGTCTVCQTRHFLPTLATMNRPVITDFSEARLGLGPHRDDIMPDVYRAPEVIFDAPWDEKVDIWNLGVLLWTLLEGQNLFYGRDLEGQLNNYHHLAEMVALLGPPPANVVAAGELGLKYFEADGIWKGVLEVPSTSLEEKERQLEGDEKAEFLRLLRRMLQWDPASRPSARELIYDEFLTGDYGLQK